MSKIRTIKDLDIKGKKVLVRVDLNVPIVNGQISNDERIKRILPTIKYLKEYNCKIILISHFGRPKGQVVPDMSLKLVANYINEKEFPVSFMNNCIGEQVENKVAELKDGEVLILENLRFHSGETQNDSVFAESLSKFADIYVNDTFSCSHRAHASIEAITHLLPSAAGLLLEEEINALEGLLSNPCKPLLAIIGGSKVSTKLSLLKNLSKTADMIFIGGAMANTFLKAKGYNIGKSYYEEDLVETANEIAETAEANNCEILLPVDVVTAERIEPYIDCKLFSAEAIGDKESMILDIGPKTVAMLHQKIQSAETIIWNGPLGVFETKPFDIGTQSLAREIISCSRDRKIATIAGGGDVVSALSESGLLHSFTYVSTGGGAFLEWLEGMKLPGIKALQLPPEESIEDCMLL